MADKNHYDESFPCEGSRELNGEQASYRSANMVSQPKRIVKRRIRGGLVPMRIDDELPGKL